MGLHAAMRATPLMILLIAGAGGWWVASDVREAGPTAGLTASLVGTRPLTSSDSRSRFRAEWEIVNNLDSDVVLNEIVPSCACMEVVNAPRVLEPGKFARLQCDIAIGGGTQFTGGARLTYRGGMCLLPAVTVTGVVDHEFFVGTATFELGVVEAGSSRSIEVAIEAVGTSDLAEIPVQVTIDPDDPIEVVAASFNRSLESMGPMKKRRGVVTLRVSPSRSRAMGRSNVEISATIAGVPHLRRVLVAWTAPETYRVEPKSIYLGSLPRSSDRVRVITVRRRDGARFRLIDAVESGAARVEVQSRHKDLAIEHRLRLGITAPQSIGAFASRLECEFTTDNATRIDKLELVVAGVVTEEVPKR